MFCDTTVTALNLSVEDARKVIGGIISVPVDDKVTFEIISAETIMDEFDYPGVRVRINAYFENSRQPIRVE